MFVVKATLPVLQQLVTAGRACETTVAVRAGNSGRVSPAGSFLVTTIKPRLRPESVTSSVLLWLLAPLLGAFHFIFISLKTPRGYYIRGGLLYLLYNQYGCHNDQCAVTFDMLGMKLDGQVIVATLWERPFQYFASVGES